MSIQPHFFHFCNRCNHCVCMKARGKAREGKGYMFNLIPWLFFVWDGTLKEDEAGWRCTTHWS
jgi:hypothetical protein